MAEGTKVEGSREKKYSLCYCELVGALLLGKVPLSTLLKSVMFWPPAVSFFVLFWNVLV